MYCWNCGAEVNDNAVVCVKCGCAVKNPNVKEHQNASPISRNWLICLLLCFFAGTFGIHRFYVGKIGSGIAQILTLGGLGIWTFIDFILIILGKFTDADGNEIRP